MILKMCLCGRRRSSVTVIKLLALLSVFVLLYYIHGKSSTYPADQISDKIHVVEKVDNPADENVVAVAGGDEDAGAAPVKLPVPPVVSVPNNKCGITEMCRSTEKVFHLISGESQERTPTICLDGKFFIGGDNPELYAGRGMNLIVVDKEANKVLKARNFDLYMFDDGEMIAWLKSLGNGDILMVATFDDAARQLTAETREILKKDFGSTKIDDLNFRGNWVFIGQKGISGSSSYENIELFNSEVSEWALQTSIHGCLTLPVGREQHKVDGSIDESVPTSKCGFSESCPEDTIAFNVISGSHVGNQKVLPSVCIDGDIVIGGNKYIPGRGINIVVMDPQSKQIMNTKTFDTYETEKESIRLVEFIKSLADGLIVVATTYDEASHRITYDARNELASIGSSHIHSLDYRDSWSLVGQKGLMGVSPYEVIHDRVGQGWGAHATIKECVPLKIESVGGQNVVLKNGKRGDFCKQYEGYGDFCSEENINKPLQPKSLDDESLKKNPAYSTPILVIPGLDLYALRKTLDSLLEVPGLNPDVVMVGNDGDFSEPKSLVDLYGFKNMILQITTKYQYHMHKGMEEVFKKFPKSEYVIVVEEQLQVSPDFLNYFAQTLPLLEKDSSILAISAFNQNGFMNTSGDPTRLYRTEDFPGLGWVLRKSVWNELQPQLKDCCDSRSWDQWLKGNLKGREMVVPDVSRVAWFKKDGFSSDQSFLDTYFNDRRTLRDNHAELFNVDSLTKDTYETTINGLLRKGIALDTTNAKLCLDGKGLGFQLPKGKGDLYTIFYEQTDESDQELLKKLCKCFGLFAMDDYTVRGLHKGMLRFFYKDNNYMLIGSSSPYMAEKPPYIDVVSKKLLKS